MLRKAFDRLQIFFSSRAFRRRFWPVTPKLKAVHLRNCKVIEDRVHMLETIPRNGVYAELGILNGAYSQHILNRLSPSELHLIDIDKRSTDAARQRFENEITSGKVIVHRSDSSDFLLSVDPETFDWIYIDADHSYEGVRNDLKAAHQAIKPDGLISLNDYIFFGPSDLTKYGVIEAVNEFCLQHDYQLVSLALHGRMYNDVTIRRMEK